jgi:hypothetical protein
MCTRYEYEANQQLGTLERYLQKTSLKLHPGPLRHLYAEADLALRDHLDRIREAAGNAE